MTKNNILIVTFILVVYAFLPMMIISSQVGGNFNNQWPFWFDDSSLMDLNKLLLLPVVLILFAHFNNSKAYYGLLAFGLCISFLFKHMGSSLSSQILLLAMALISLANVYAYLKYTGDSIDDWVQYKFKSTKTASGPKNDTTQTSIKKSNITFSDVLGNTELKAKLLKIGNEIVKNKGKKNGILFLGEPGNGKTTLAKALAGTLKLGFMEVNFGNVASKWVNETTERVMRIFDDAEKAAPCMLFIDEIDAVLVDRNGIDNADSESAKTVAALLKRLEDIREKGVVLVAATNYPDKLDQAAIREGRFDYKIEITPPDYEARLGLLLNGLKTVINKVDKSAIERVAKRWEGYSVSRINAIASEAVENLNEGKSAVIGFEEMMNALRATQYSKGNMISESALSIKDLILEDERRGDLNRLVQRMTNIELVEQMGGTIPNGLLFFGPAGTGKTAVAQALAKDSGWSFIATTGHDLVRKPQSIEEIIKKAKNISPCIIFIDEADDVIANRETSLMSKDVTNKLLTVMDGSAGKVKDILFIAATNHPDMVDPAMRRGGRFTEKLEFSLPNKEQIAAYVDIWLNTTAAKLANTLDKIVICSMLEGQSMSNIKEIFKLAVNESIDFDNAENSRVELFNIEKAIRAVNGY